MNQVGFFFEISFGHNTNWFNELGTGGMSPEGRPSDNGWLDKQCFKNGGFTRKT
jgi:hypothetical protein